MSECQHKNRKYSKREVLTSKPPKRPWICPDCGATGADPIRGRKDPLTAIVINKVVR